MSPFPFNPNRLTQGLCCVSTQRQHWKMRPNVLWKNVKLQTLHANSLQPVTSKLSGDFHRYSISLIPQSAQSYFNDGHQLCMFSHVSYSAFLAGRDTWTEHLCAKENPFFLLLLLWHNKRGVKLSSARDLWHKFVLVFTHCKKSMRHKSRRKMVLTGMKFYRHPPDVSASLHIS